MLYQGDEQVAVLFLRIETYWQQAGGHLWWRRWSQPEEAVHGYILHTDGTFDDFLEDLADIVEELEDWRLGRFPYRGRVLRVQWFDDTGSRDVRIGSFGLDDPNIDSRAVDP